MHASLIKEQKRTVVSKAKFSRAQKISEKKKASIDENKKRLTEQLSALRSPKVIVPNFQLLPSEKARGVLVAINDASIAYNEDKPLIKDLHLSLSSQDKVALVGDHGSSKSTLLKALLNFPDIIKMGEWRLPNEDAVGYLDQHYANVPPNKTVFEVLSDLVPDWEDQKVRRHLNDFLFKRNQAVSNLVKTLSRGTALSRLFNFDACRAGFL